MPFGIGKQVHFGNGLMDPVLAEDPQTCAQRFPANRDVESLGDGDDRDAVRLAAGASDALADLGEVLGDVHRVARAAGFNPAATALTWMSPRVAGSDN